MSTGAPGFHCQGEDEQAGLSMPSRLVSFFNFGRSTCSRGADIARVWHEEGKGREELLPRLEQTLQAAGMRVTRDDGWQSYDLRISRGPWVYSNLLTVTEYHENGAALTRVRSTPRATGASVIALLGLAVSLAWGGHIVLAALVPVAVIISAICSGSWLRAEIAKAAGEMGGTMKDLE